MTTTGATEDLAILAVLDRDSDEKGLREIVLGWGGRLHVRRTLAGLRRQLDREPPDVVVSNTSLRDRSNWKHVLHEIESAGGLQPVIITSRIPDDSLWAEVLNMGGFDVIAEPFDRDEVARILSSAARERRHALRPGPQKEVRVLSQCAAS